MSYTYLMTVHICPSAFLPPFLSPGSIAGCWWLFSHVNTVVFCSVFRQAVWPCSSLFILTLLTLTRPSSSWVCLHLSVLTSLSNISVSCSAPRLPLWLHYPNCRKVAFGVILFGLWQIRVAVCDHGGLGHFCILLRVSHFFLLPLLTAFLFLYFPCSVSKLNIM